MKRIIKLLAFAAIIITTTSCYEYELIMPSGGVRSFQRNTRSFDRINVSNGIELYITQDNRNSLIVETNSNLHEFIITEVKDRTLRIYRDRSVRFFGNPRVKVFISCNYLETIHSSGGGLVEFETLWYGNSLGCYLSGGGELYADLDLLDFDLSLSGGSYAETYGFADNLYITSSGGSRLISNELQSQYCNINISGGGLARVRVAQRLNVDASGGSKVLFIGNPFITSNLSGGSIVARY